MTDVVDRATRSRMMSGIRGSNTRPEIRVRRYLHRSGLRFRLHRAGLPGRPDIVLPRFRAALFVHGCFWHRHDGCRYTTSPKTRPAFWESKFRQNVERDRKNVNDLLELGWRVLVIWECGIRNHPDRMMEIADWIRGPESFSEWPEKNPP
ncbi:DNA mismatch endonuclease Vsr [Spectribacter hydrogenoxidans]|uniref:Very short patch repair endonuclease n=1 Tax=Spectribacter hydrogenoxidans TaxID=3075608 RepID=A0ABU3BVL2_9GAMM|nr:DNA mismatch endonuclease Vsr [Salinisphaera sp. W335]MDT0633331.1 DNA mismatch endonuclease Vsr [Salinisphaera sp. W335]